MIGEGTRIPIVQKIAKEIFKKEAVNRTLNSAEAIAQGCSLTAAMILPHFHVANFQIEECNTMPVDISWSITGGDMKAKTLFPVKNNFPSIKSMTFDNRTEPIDIGVSYNDPATILGGMPTALARYRVEIPKPEHPKFSLKLRVKLDQNCIPGLDTAELIEEYKEEKKIAVKAAPPPAPKKDENGDTEMKDQAADEKKEEPKAPEQQYETKIVDKTRSTNINFKWEKHGLTTSAINDFQKQEVEMYTQDRKILEVKEAKNRLESYVYDMRDKCGDYGDRKHLIEEAIRQEFLTSLNETESWLYESERTQDEYEKRLGELTKVGEPVNYRFRFYDSLGYRKEQLNLVLKAAEENGSKIPEDSHITKEEKEALLKLVSETQAWQTEMDEKLSKINKWEDPGYTLNQLEDKQKLVVELSNKTLNKPKPAPKKEEKKEEKADEKKEDKPEGEQPADGEKPAQSQDEPMPDANAPQAEGGDMLD